MKRESELRKKLHSQSGETIGETLVALLISSLALVMLASMITSTVNLVTKSETKMETYYRANAALENLSVGDTTIITITGESETLCRESVRYAINNTFNKTVVAYSYAGDLAADEGDNTVGG